TGSTTGDPPPKERSVTDRLLEAPLSDATDTFLFSELYCGCDRTGYLQTKLYKPGNEEVSLRDAIALSGAAVSPMQFHSPLSLFMAVLNLRLGQWLPRPRRSPPGGQPHLLQLLSDRGDIDKREYFFISDGGHHENLGLGVLLQRRCRLILVSDATA